jgi:hypothetical protein
MPGALPLQAPLLDTLLSCVPAHPTCLDLLPALVMGAARHPIAPTGKHSQALRAACALAGWCAESWLLADKPLLQEAAHTLVAALVNHCEPYSIE